MWVDHKDAGVVPIHSLIIRGLTYAPTLAAIGHGRNAEQKLAEDWFKIPIKTGVANVQRYRGPPRQQMRPVFFGLP